MAKPEIIGSARSTYTRVVRMVCEEKGIDYTLKETTLGSPELRAIHPFGKMPVLRAIAFNSNSSTWPWRVMDRTLIRTYLYAYIAAKTLDGRPDRGARAIGNSRSCGRRDRLSRRQPVHLYRHQSDANPGADQACANASTWRRFN